MTGVPSSPQYRPQLDALRAFAVVAVLITHFWQPDPLPWILRQVDLGFLGVRLFFVLSGFLITRILLECRDQVDTLGVRPSLVLCRFYGRRFLRIFPLAYFVIFVGVLLGIPPARDIWPWLVTYSSNFYTALWQQNTMYFGHFWTLAVEEQFYVVWPWLLLFVPRRWLMIVVCLIVSTAPIYRDAMLSRGAGWGTLPWNCLDTLGVGAMLAIAKHGSRATDAFYSTLRRVILPIGLFGYLGLHAFARTDGGRLLITFHELAYAMVCCWLIAYADRGFTGSIGRLLEFGPLVHIGKISYGIYVYHMFMPFLLGKGFQSVGWAFPPPGPTRFLLATLATLAVAMASWQFFERPINNLKDRLPYSRPSRSAMERPADLPSAFNFGSHLR
jgi:peptidoglycan/LPS O-acetylase OafA/YrhL